MSWPAWEEALDTKAFVRISAAIEAVTGFAFILSPSLIVRLLLGGDLGAVGIVVGRVCSFGLLSLAIACWPGRGDASQQATRALFTYNLLASVYLAYLRFGGGFVSYILLLACGLHALLTILMLFSLRAKLRSVLNVL